MVKSSKAESELKQKVKVMEAVAGEVKSGNESELVIVSETRNLGDDENAAQLLAVNKKLEESNKRNSMLKDELEKTKISHKGVDEFYRVIIEEKEAVIKEYINITKNDGEESVKLRRLLVKFRSENELKQINELKDFLSDESKKQAQKSSAQKESESVKTPDVSNKQAQKSIDQRESESVRVPDVNNIRDQNENHDTGNVVRNNGQRNVNNGRKGLCRDGKSCSSMESCEFRHDIINKPCRYGQQCSKKQKCLFMHINTRQSFFGHYLQNESAQGRSPPYITDSLRNGRNEGSDPLMNEPVNNDQHGQRRKKLCWNGRSCQINNCSFWHETITRS